MKWSNYHPGSICKPSYNALRLFGCFFNTNHFGILNDWSLLLLIKLLFAHTTFSFLLYGESCNFFQMVRLIAFKDFSCL
jgi:hypothetical protein